MDVNWAVTFFVIIIPGWLIHHYGMKLYGKWGRRAGCLVWWLCLIVAGFIFALALTRVPILLGVDRADDWLSSSTGRQGTGSDGVVLGSAGGALGRAQGPTALSSLGSATGGGEIPYWDVYVKACSDAGEPASSSCPLILAAVASVESGFDPNAVSSANAGGLFQVMPLHGLGDGVFEPSIAAPYAWKLLVDWGVREDPAMASCRYLRGASGCTSTGGLGNAVTLDYVRDIYGTGGVPPHLRTRLGVGFSTPRITQYWHGLAGFKGCDITAPGLGGDELLAPLTGVVTFNGDDGLRVGTTMLTIKGLVGAEKVTLLHGDYDVAVGDVVIAGWSHIGREASRGNSTGPHSHYIYYNKAGVNEKPWWC